MLRYNQDAWEMWHEFTKYISPDNFPPTLHQEKVKQVPADLGTHELSQWMEKHHKSRFELAFSDTHQGNVEAFLAEFQFAFLRWFIENDDAEACPRWSHLLQAVYNAGERAIAKTPSLFINLIDILMRSKNLRPYFGGRSIR
ncbi:MAG: hypothetical protein F6K24_14400 [Okeania sp. SIO2D1]|nr:hypothetical protein [Okeania sp. SIO2D1]